MSSFLRKALGDIKESWFRSMLLFASIFVSTVLLTAALSAKDILSREIGNSFQSGLPPHAVLWSEVGFNAEQLSVIRAADISAAAMQRVIRARVKIDADHWETARITIAEQLLSEPVANVHTHEILIDKDVMVEQSSVPMFSGLAVPSTLTVQTPSGRVSTLSVSGVVHDTGVAPGWMDKVIYLYASPQTASLFGEGDVYDQVQVRFNDGAQRREAARALSEYLVQHRISFDRLEVIDNEGHPHADQMKAVLGLLQVFSWIALVMSSALIASVISTTMKRQTRQIGAMKALGATTLDVSLIYVLYSALLAFPAVLIGLLAGSFVGRQFSFHASEQLNIEVTRLSASLSVYVLSGLVGILVTFVVLVAPVWLLARRSVRECLDDVGFAEQLPSVYPSHHRSL
jgi:putative ABC transport system permease protein